MTPVRPIAGCRAASCRLRAPGIRFAAFTSGLLVATFAGAAGEVAFDQANNLEVEVDVELVLELAGNADLDSDADADVGELAPEVGINVAYAPNEHVLATLVVLASRSEFVVDDADEENSESRLELDEAWLRFGDSDNGPTLTLGRQPFVDSYREWLFDETLDAVRVGYVLGRLDLELALGQELLFERNLAAAEIRPRIVTALAQARYQIAPAHALVAYALRRQGRDSNNRLIHAGLRSLGELTPSLAHWVELAWVFGREDGVDVEGHAIDVGGTLTLDHPLSPSLTLGYAFGSGDADPGDGTDRAFRQSGLQSNESLLGGVARLKHYGEVLDAELSNLHVVSVGLGLRQAERRSLNVVYHAYRQDTLADDLRDTRLDGELRAGRRSPFLGHGLDIVAGVRDLGGVEELELDAAIGRFWPGPAWAADSDDPAWSLRVELGWSF